MSNQTIFNVEGTVKSVIEPEDISKDPKKKMLKGGVVLTCDFSTDKYQNYQEIMFDAWNKQNEQVKKLNKGDKVEVAFGIRSNKFKDRYFTNLNVISVKILESQAELFDEKETEDDLPF